MSNENRKEDQVTLFIRFWCGSAQHIQPFDLSVAADHFADGNLQFFIADHIHKEIDRDRMDEDKSALYTVLSKFLTEDLPRISEIMARRKLMFGFEVKPRDLSTR